MMLTDQNKDLMDQISNLKAEAQNKRRMELMKAQIQDLSQQLEQQQEDN